MYAYLAFLLLVVDLEFEEQRGELADVDETVVAAAAADEELDLLVAHAVRLELLGRLADVQLPAAVLVQRLELLHHRLGASTTTQ